MSVSLDAIFLLGIHCWKSSFNLMDNRTVSTSSIILFQMLLYINEATVAVS